ncbi:odorant receptor 108 [Tribolium castaneum]|uniref:Odorant receptor n=2 Tax=Tribolium castaneum TaxID=7070 RepID=D6WV56_TRICA|nr:odorant receptor 108 [Tribolium castaneum]
MEKALKLVNILGLDPRKNDTFSKFRSIFCFTILISASFSSHLEFFLNFKGLETCERAAESIIPQYQTMCKMATFLLYKTEMLDLIKKSERFWKLDRFGDLQAKNLHSTYPIFQIFFYVYVVILFLTCAMFALVNWIFDTGKPISLCYGESEGLETPWVEFYIVLQSVEVTIIFLGITGYDMVFLYYAGSVCIQFQMLKMAFAERKMNERQFLKAVKHHEFLLQYVEQLGDIYSMWFLLQYFSSLFGICFGLFLISKEGLPTEPERLSKYFPYIFSFTMQSFTFCMTGTMLSDWSSEISDEIFHSDWSDDQVYKNKTARLIVMNRAQRPAKISIGKFLDLNLRSFILLMRSVFSFLAFVNNILNRIN